MTEYFSATNKENIAHFKERQAAYRRRRFFLEAYPEARFHTHTDDYPEAVADSVAVFETRLQEPEPHTKVRTDVDFRRFALLSAGLTDSKIAWEEGVSRMAIYHWERRFGKRLAASVSPFELVHMADILYALKLARATEAEPAISPSFEVSIDDVQLLSRQKRLQDRQDPRDTTAAAAGGC